MFGGSALARASRTDTDRTLDLLFRYGFDRIDMDARCETQSRTSAREMARLESDKVLKTARTTL